MKQRFGMPLLLLLAAAQAMSAAALLYWALPLFADPPMLGNGIAARAHELERLARTLPENHELTGLGQYLRWLFERHLEGVFAALAAAIVLVISAVASAAVALASSK